MKRGLIAGLIGLMMMGTLSLASEGGQNPPQGKKPEIDKALQECADSLGVGSTGKPDMEKMDACMSAKGFKKPSGPPQGPGGGQPLEKP